MMNFRDRLQVAEAFGSINRWFCSEAYGREITDPELLLAYYINSGGAADFARRYDEAMGMLNRWYCSEFYCCDIRDPRILWDYYVSHAPARALADDPRCEPGVALAELSIAC
ncbi:MAG TPA: hypothetical protein VHX86_09110 [Tepidisphaeraceae bacterium]|jgi:hypothetical protein|nr:hypothetical protein [Tepidisphaeraceae bacterium]